MKKKLHPGVKWSWRISNYLGSIFILIFLSAFIISMIAAFSENYIVTIVVIFIGLLIIEIIFTEVWIHMAYNRWFYEFSPESLKIEYGIIWKTYKNIPYERIQNIDIKRGIIARMLGFSLVSIQTAGYSGMRARGTGFSAEGTIPAVAVDEAEKIRNFVIQKISKKSNQGL